MTTPPGSGSAPRVCVAIPAYRSLHLRECLESLVGMSADGIPFEVRVVLNDATPEVREIAAAYASSTVHIHDLPMNLGVAGGLNTGFGASSAPLLLGMQDDAAVEPGWIRHLVDRIDDAPDIGAVGCLTLHPDGQVWDAGWVVWDDGITSPVWLNASRNPDDHTESRAIAQHGSGGLLLRREAWESIGGFDDAFYPAYYGDVDICLSLRSRGWRLIYEPRSRMRHQVHSTSTASYSRFLLERNRRTLLEKHGAFLAGAGASTDDPEAIAREAARIAAAPAGPRPADPTPEELETLRTRLARTPEQVLRWERDVLAEYARHLEARSAEDAEAIARAKAEAAAGWRSSDETNATLAEVYGSRSWRLTAPLRSLRARSRH